MNTSRKNRVQFPEMEIADEGLVRKAFKRSIDWRYFYWLTLIKVYRDLIVHDRTIMCPDFEHKSLQRRSQHPGDFIIHAFTSEKYSQVRYSAWKRRLRSDLCTTDTRAYYPRRSSGEFFTMWYGQNGTFTNAHEKIHLRYHRYRTYRAKIHLQQAWVKAHLVKDMSKIALGHRDNRDTSILPSYQPKSLQTSMNRHCSLA